MKRGPKLTPVAIMANRMSALIQQQPIRSRRREELIALLRDEMSAPPGKEARAR